jgi:DNA mismatch repair protein MutS2
MQAERDTLITERQAAQRERGALAHEKDTFEAERRAFAERADEAMAKSLRDFTTELARRAEANESKRPKVTASQSALLSRNAEALRRSLGVEKETADEGPSGAFATHDPVRVLSMRANGEVVEDYGDTVLVTIGPMKMVVQKSDLQRNAKAARATRKQERASDSGRGAKMEAATRSMAELDVRGQRFVDAEPIVDRWIDEAVLAGNSPLRLIHGKGTGMLGRGLQEHLRTHTAVKSFRYGHEDEGSGGVTIIELQ